MRWNSRCQILGNIYEPQGFFYGDGHEVLIRKSLIEGELLAFYNKPREMIRNGVLGPRLILDVKIKVL